jgi:hypothetical protein
MPSSPWRSIHSAGADRECIALLSYLPLKSYARLPAFFWYTLQTMKQLASAKGIFGYTLLAHPLEKKAWTLSAWESTEALEAFIEDSPHVRIMGLLAPHLGNTAFLRWTVKGSELPLRWPDALTRFAREQPTTAR